MKHLLIVLTSCLTLNGYCQITYTANDGPKIGQEIEFKKLKSLIGFDLNALAQSGANLIWDVKGDSEDDRIIKYSGVSNLPFKSLFPGANMAQTEFPNLDSAYNLLEKNSSGLFWLGFRDTSTTVVFNSKYTLVPYPLNFGMNFQNTLDADFTADGLTFKLEIQSNANVDSWGVISTNEGSYPVIKLLTRQILEITTSGIPIASSTIVLHSWIASGYSNPVVELEYNETESPFGIFNDTTLSYLHKQELVSNKELIKPEFKLQITPNPVNNWVEISLPNKDFKTADYEIINQDGKKMMSGKLMNNEILNLNIQNLIPGNYLVQFILDNKELVFEILTKQ